MARRQFSQALIEEVKLRIIRSTVPGSDTAMKRIVVVCATLFCSLLWADPAPWYKWHSPEGGLDICSQISPGDGWVIVKGPYADAVCKKLGVPH